MRLRKRETCSAFDPCDNELITIYCTFRICIFIHYTLRNIIIYLVYIKVVVRIGIALFHSQGFSGGICCLQTNNWSRQLDRHFIHHLFRIFRIWDRKLAVRLYGNNSKDLKLTLSKCVGIQAVYLTMSAPILFSSRTILAVCSMLFSETVFEGVWARFVMHTFRAKYIWAIPCLFRMTIYLTTWS